ncbi:hypothetical protein Sjap_002538 [Stephania japonica]|uniref:Uncharacterized protein n=1 Tax=Stephania japonica TaxID=461633 RepID=A0AAP0KNM7_9MAGN
MLSLPLPHQKAQQVLKNLVKVSWLVVMISPHREVAQYLKVVEGYLQGILIQTIGTSIPTEPHGLTTRGGQRGRGTIPSLLILGSRSLDHELHSTSPSPSISLASQVPSTSLPRTLPNRPLQSPSVSLSSRQGNLIPAIHAPPAIASPTTFDEGKAGSQVAGAL